MKAILALACFALACSSEPPRAVTVPPPPPPQESAKPVASVSHPAGNACVMLYECGCNAGCTKVDRPMDQLRPGTQVGVTSGPLKGEKVFVAKQQTASGDTVLTVQRADPNASEGACGLVRSSNIGYGCQVSDSGAARACTRCE